MATFNGITRDISFYPYLFIRLLIVRAIRYGNCLMFPPTRLSYLIIRPMNRDLTQELDVAWTTPVVLDAPHATITRAARLKSWLYSDCAEKT